MIAPRVKINADRLRELLPRYIAETRKGVQAGTLTVARTVTKNLIKYTAPFDKSNFTSAVAAKKVGEAALDRDIGEVYWTINQLFGYLKDSGFLKQAKAIRRLCTAGQFGEAEAVLRATGTRLRNVEIGFFDGGKKHRESRSKRDGRVHRHVPALIVVDLHRLKEYRKQQKPTVGFTRGGWISAALSGAIGGMNGLPKWVTTWAGRSPGSGLKRETQKGFTIRLTNAVSWCSRALRQEKLADALRDAHDALVKQMNAIIAHRASKRLK